MKLIFRISILNRHIISELLPPLYLGLIVFAIIGELVGISFLQ